MIWEAGSWHRGPAGCLPVHHCPRRRWIEGGAEPAVGCWGLVTVLSAFCFVFFFFRKMGNKVMR